MEAILAHRINRRVLCDIKLLQSNIITVLVVIPSLKVEFMLSTLWFPTRKNWEAVFIFFFHEAFHDLPALDNYCLSPNNGMLFVEEFKVLILSNIEESSYELMCFLIVCVYDCSFVRLFYKHMKFFCAPKSIPNFFKRNFFETTRPVFPQKARNFRWQITFLSLLEPH